MTVIYLAIIPVFHRPRRVQGAGLPRGGEARSTQSSRPVHRTQDPPAGRART